MDSVACCEAVPPAVPAVTVTSAEIFCRQATEDLHRRVWRLGAGAVRGHAVFFGRLRLFAAACGSGAALMTDGLGVVRKGTDGAGGARRRRRQSETTGRRLHGVSWRGRASRERTKRVSAGSVTRELLMAGDNRAVAATHLALAITTGRSATSTSFDENAPSRRSARLRSVDVPRSGRTFCDTPSPDDSAPSATRGDRNPRCARRRPTRSWQLRDALRSAAALRLANVGETPRHGPRVPGAAAPFAHPFSATQSSRCCSSTPLPERALGPAERAMRRDDL